MPNRLTAVPRRPVPTLHPALTPVVLAADAFMGLMLSRPGGLSLRRAWVTPGTLVLAAGCTLAGLVLAGVLVARGGWETIISCILGAISLLSCSVVVVGVAQRRSTPR